MKHKLIVVLLSLFILSSCSSGENIVNDKAMEGKDIIFPFGLVRDPDTEDLSPQQKVLGEIFKIANTQPIESLITKTCSESELLKNWHFGGSEDAVTHLWSLTKYHSVEAVECFRVFTGTSLPYAVFKLEEGGYFFTFFHKGNSCDYAFVVKKPLTRKDFKSGNIVPQIDITNNSRYIWGQVVNPIIPSTRDRGYNHER